MHKVYTHKAHTSYKKHRRNYIHTINNRTKSKSTNRSVTTKRIDKKIFILSYNISWESMTGNVSIWPLCSNNTDKSNPKNNSVCISNIGKVINDNKTDFVTLQEAGEYKKLLSVSPRLSMMKYKTHKSGLNVIVTFWNNTYKFIKKITGEFDIGRPWMAIIFSNGICLINVHCGHYNSNKVTEKLKKLIKNINDNIHIFQMFGNKQLSTTHKNNSVKNKK